MCQQKSPQWRQALDPGWLAGSGFQCRFRCSLLEVKNEWSFRFDGRQCGSGSKSYAPCRCADQWAPHCRHRLRGWPPRSVHRWWSRYPAGNREAGCILCRQTEDPHRGLRPVFLHEENRLCHWYSGHFWRDGLFVHHLRWPRDFLYTCRKVPWPGRNLLRLRPEWRWCGYADS